MSYSGISIREAMEKINQFNGWFLPQVQRQYIWGARFESETYICLLLDSLYKRYPIGGLVLWETDQSVPFREFVNDYYPGQFAKQVEPGRWGSYKTLVYDGQQRLQTLRSALYYTFNGRVLCFNLQFDKDKAEADETGFFFLDKGVKIPPSFIKMTEVSCTICDPKEKAKLEIKYLDANGINGDQKLLVRTNLGALWDVFVDTNIKSIAYFLLPANYNEEQVNEVFRRLNTGGITLTQIELVLAKVKAKYSDFEEGLWEIANEIERATGGFKFTSAEILQFFYLLIFGTFKVEERRVKTEHVDEFKKHLIQSKAVLLEYFGQYLWGQLKINHSAIVPRQHAMLPIVVYLATLKAYGYSFEIKRLLEDNIKAIHQFFVLSQFGDWNTQTMVNAFAQEAKKAGENGFNFPLEEIKSIVKQKNRDESLNYHQFLSQPWLALKILTPARCYIFFENKPQVDHIFPLELKGMDDDYKKRVDVLWNLQPIPAGVNNYKRARHPKKFFEDSDGKKFFGEYDFLPNLDSGRWEDERKFIHYRHLKMRKELLTRYGLRLKRIRAQKNK